MFYESCNNVRISQDGRQLSVSRTCSRKKWKEGKESEKYIVGDFHPLKDSILSRNMGSYSGQDFILHVLGCIVVCVCVCSFICPSIRRLGVREKG